MSKHYDKETVRDTLIDLFGYSLIGLAMVDGAWKEESGDDSSIYDHIFRHDIYRDFDDLFEGKLKRYGVHDITKLEQVMQRMTEKIMRINNITKTDDYRILIKRHDKSHDGIMQPQKEGDVGMDLVVSEDFEIPPFGHFPVNVPCAFNAKLPTGYWAEIRPRSSTATKLGVLVYQSVMDTGYTGPWFVIAHSILGKTVKIEKGTRLAQCILHESKVPPIKFVDELPRTERGDTGFGSSGIKHEQKV